MPQKIPETLKKRGYNSTNFKVLKVFFFNWNSSKFSETGLKKRGNTSTKWSFKKYGNASKKRGMELHLNCF